MYNISTLNNFNIYNNMQTQKNNAMSASSAVSSLHTNPVNTCSSAKNITASQVALNFKANNIRTSLSGKDEQQKYNEVASIIDKSLKKDLQLLLKTGKLLNNDSNDKSTTLDNLYKIATTTRIEGLDKKKLVQDVVMTLSNPFRITQKFGDIPVGLQGSLIEAEKNNGQNITAMDLDVKSSTCPAASIEFNLAHKMPAEFVRMAEGLTSKDICVEKNIKINDLSQSFLNTLWMLNEFGTEHTLIDKDVVNVKIRPDRNAIVRARVQNTYQDADERSPIDVLMQSTFMNVGAQNTYNALVDKRTPKYNEDNSGLIDIEKNFAEELATGKGKVCVTYQKIDDNGRLVGYECEHSETLSHIKNTLNEGHNVIIGYTYCDDSNNVIGGHEITIIGIEKDKKGNEYFVCNDTDDGISDKIKYPVSELLPKIHHAGIPKSVLDGNVEFVEGWKELMEMYKASKTQQQIQQSYQFNPLTVINSAA